LLSAIFMKIFW